MISSHQLSGVRSASNSCVGQVDERECWGDGKQKRLHLPGDSIMAGAVDTERAVTKHPASRKSVMPGLICKMSPFLNVGNNQT